MAVLPTLIFVLYLTLSESALVKDGFPPIEPKTLVKDGFPPIEPKIETGTPKATTIDCNNAQPVSLVGTSSDNPIVIQSPNYPNNYNNNLNCLFNFNLAANTKVTVEVIDSSLECPYDHIDFGFNNKATYSSSCPTAGALTFTAPSSSQTFQVSFISDYSITYRGFRMNVYASTTTATAACTCGKWTSRDGDRIVNGTIAAPHSLPYQIGLVSSSGKTPFCGGTLISPNYAMTAAHCTVNTPASNIRITVGDVNFRNLADGEMFINVDQIFVHPNYNGSKSQDYDYSILKLAGPAPIGNSVNIACLPPNLTDTFVGTNFTISGWGTTSSGGSQSPDLKVSYVTGMSNKDCGRYYGVTPRMICATVPNVDTDTCQGDSGGPLVTSINGKVTLVGVTSFGYKCAFNPYPGVYARITAQQDWILQNSDAQNCQN